MNTVPNQFLVRSLPAERPFSDAVRTYSKRFLVFVTTVTVAGACFFVITLLSALSTKALLAPSIGLLLLSGALFLATLAIVSVHREAYFAVLAEMFDSREQSLLMLQSDRDPKVTDFQRLGFLSATSERNAIAFLKQKEWVQLYFDLNQTSQKALLAIAVSNQDPQRVLAHGVFNRLITTYQSVFLLVQRGIDLEPKVLLRTMTEALIVFVASAKSSDFATRYIKSDEDTRRKLLEKTLRRLSEQTPEQEQFFMGPLPIKQMQAELADLNRRRAAAELEPEMRKEDIAAEAGLSHLYLSHFAYFSLFTHLTPSGMRDLVKTDDKGAITHFRFGVNYDDAFTNLRVAMVLMTSGLMTADPLFQLKLQGEVDKLEQRFSKLISRASRE